MTERLKQKIESINFIHTNIYIHAYRQTRQTCSHTFTNRIVRAKLQHVGFKHFTHIYINTHNWEIE